MTDNVVSFKPRADGRVPARFEAVHRAGVVRGVAVEIWRTRDSNSMNIVSSPTPTGFTTVGNLTADMPDIDIMMSVTVLDTLRAADETWAECLPPAS